MDAPESRPRAVLQVGPHAPGTGPRDGRPALSPLLPRTLVEQVADAIVRAAALGELLPGDRVVEADLARLLRVSRVPVREALRMLESQGVVVNTPYRGMRLMEVSADRLRAILRVRLELERLAVREVLARPGAREALVAELAALCRAMGAAAARGDGYELARLDTEFHHALCRASGNEALLGSFGPLARQLTVIFGFSALQKELAPVVAEHVELCRALARGEEAELIELLRVHIIEANEALDHEAFIRSRRR